MLQYVGIVCFLFVFIHLSNLKIPKDHKPCLTYFVYQCPKALHFKKTLNRVFSQKPNVY